MTLVRSDPGPVWRLTLDRPEARNAVSESMLGELVSALGDAAVNAEARVVVLAGEGAHFSAGADLGEIDAARDDAGGARYEAALGEALSAIEDHPLPVLAEVRGAALGAGCQLAVACDIAVAAADARIGIPSSRLGLVIPFESIERLVLAVGPKRAAEILFTGRDLSGEEAAAWGLVNEVAPAERLDERVATLADQIAAAAPLSVRTSKRGLRAVLRRLSVDREAEGYRVVDFDMMAAEAFASEDLREGLAAHRERRKPRFRGR